MRMGVMNVLLLLNQRERMREIVVIGRDDGKARRETDTRKYGHKKYCRTWLSCEDPQGDLRCPGRTRERLNTN